MAVLPSELVKRSLKGAGYKPYEAAPSLYHNPADWIEHHFYLYDTLNLITLYDCQRRPLELALSKRPNGDYEYLTVLWSWPKKSAKSSIIAAVADYRADHTPNASIRLAANDAKQAESRVGFYLRESIHIGQRHGQRQGIQTTPSGYKMTYPNGARVECIPVDPSGEAGGNDDMIVYSELWAWKSKAHQRMWSEMTLSPNKYGKAQRWIDTYAGIRGESPVLEPLYETGVLNGRKVWDDLEVYVNETARMLTVWVTKPMFDWQTDEYYAQEAAQLTPSEFNRMHRNQWADALEGFVPYEAWLNCRAEYAPLDPNEPCIMALDAGVSSDCFAIVMVTRREDKVQVQYVRKWQPTAGRKLDFAPIEAEIRRLINSYNVLEIAYDPYQLHDMATRLRNEEVVNMREFNQASPRAIADKRLYDLILGRRIQHRSEPDLNEHIQNAHRKPEEENRLRIVKGADVNRKIDLAVVLSMATDRTYAYALE